jgi:hypothetical protein
MPTFDATIFKLAIALAAPTMATRGLLNSPQGEATAVDIVVNAYKVVIAAQNKLAKGSQSG